jgi:glycosyltransferase involved in cell wall biosynthesis
MTDHTWEIRRLRRFKVLFVELRRDKVLENRETWGTLRMDDAETPVPVPEKDSAEFFMQAKALLIGAGTENLLRMPNVLALGRRNEVERLLAAADIIVSSSAFGEGFSNALAEGMACGLPAVATDVGDARTIVGDSGCVVPARNSRALAAAIRMLAQEPAAARGERGMRARAYRLKLLHAPRRSAFCRALPVARRHLRIKPAMTNTSDRGCERDRTSACQRSSARLTALTIRSWVVSSR